MQTRKRNHAVTFGAVRRLTSFDPNRVGLFVAFVALITLLFIFPFPFAQLSGSRISSAPGALGVIPSSLSSSSSGTASQPWRHAAECALLVLLVSIVVVAYMSRFHGALYRSTKHLNLSFILTLPALFGIALCRYIEYASPGSDAAPFTIIAGVTVSAMLVCSLQRANVAGLAAALLTSLGALATGCGAAVTAIALAASLLGILLVHRIRCRKDVILVGLGETAFCALAGLYLAFLHYEPSREFVLFAAYGAVAGLAATLIYLTVEPFLERPFGLTTHMTLLELLDPSQPLLRRFAHEAPGTYAHSLMVGSLAAAAAERVGADAVLARVAALYHDLGKVRRAQFYAENQDGDNVHNRLKPSLSALVVNAHVKDGLELAGTEGLPSSIQDIIVQHHGTSLMRYFFNQAQNAGDPDCDNSLQYRFRYAGPKPQTKEAGIMMLADAVEAVSRTLVSPDRTEIEQCAKRIINEKVADGQLSECPLTLRDLTAIQEAFSQQLCGAVHRRVAYPCSEQAQCQNEAADADFDSTRESSNIKAGT